MGFESLFVLTQTSFVYFFGASSFASTNETVRFIGQILAMVGLAVTLYSTLLSGKHASMHTMLLTGIVIGTGFGALSTFMQRMLDPNEFDILRARLFGNIGNATTDFLWFVVPACFAACAALWWLSGPLNVIALGADTATNLGVAHRRYVMLTLTVVSFLMALTTSLIGPMTFLGFLTATLAYALTDTYDHRYIFPIAALAGYVLLGGAYFLLRHVFTMVDAVTIIVELIGGIVFLGVLLKKGRV